MNSTLRTKTVNNHTCFYKGKPGVRHLLSLFALLISALFSFAFKVTAEQPSAKFVGIVGTQNYSFVNDVNVKGVVVGRQRKFGYDWGHPFSWVRGRTTSLSKKIGARAIPVRVENDGSIISVVAPGRCSRLAPRKLRARNFSCPVGLPVHFSFRDIDEDSSTMMLRTGETASISRNSDTPSSSTLVLSLGSSTRSVVLPTINSAGFPAGEYSLVGVIDQFIVVRQGYSRHCGNSAPLLIDDQTLEVVQNNIPIPSNQCMSFIGMNEDGNMLVRYIGGGELYDGTVLYRRLGPTTWEPQNIEPNATYVPMGNYSIHRSGNITSEYGNFAFDSDKSPQFKSLSSLLRRIELRYPNISSVTLQKSVSSKNGFITAYLKDGYEPTRAVLIKID